MEQIRKHQNWKIWQSILGAVPEMGKICDFSSENYWKPTFSPQKGMTAPSHKKSKVSDVQES